MMIYGVNPNQGVTGQQCISANALKVFLILLCEGRLVDKFAYLFQEFASGRRNAAGSAGKGSDGANWMTRRSLSGLLRLFCKLSEFLGESQNFGSFLVESAVLQCFGNVHEDTVMQSQQSQGTNAVDVAGELTEEAFVNWILKEPQVIVWIATFYRMVSAKKVHHNVSCAGSCQQADIVGLR